MWNGIFSPTFTKSIGSVRFVPLVEMTSEDWRILEFEDLRPEAKNRIASQVVKGELLGFFHVNVTTKAKAKPDYYWPANRAMLDEFNSSKSSDFFRHEVNGGIEGGTAKRLDSLMTKAFSSLTVRTAMVIVGTLLIKAKKEENKKELEKITEENLAKLNQDDLATFISILMLWENSLEESENLISELPDSDEKDELLSELEDRQFEVDRLVGAV